MSEAKVALGERLFFEARLSVTGRYSCSSCHDPAHAFAQARPVAIGATGEALPHNAMALVNVAYNVSFGWTKPRLRSLEAQMLEPMLNEHPVELGLKGREAALCAQLAADPAYAADFAAAFPGDPAPVTFDASRQGHCDLRAHADLRRLALRSLRVQWRARGAVGCRPSTAWRCSSRRARAARRLSLRIQLLGQLARRAGRDRTGELRHATARAHSRCACRRCATSRSPPPTCTMGASPLSRRCSITTPPWRRAAARPDRRLPRVPFSSTERAALVAFLDSLTDETFVEPRPGGPRQSAAR